MANYKKYWTFTVEGRGEFPLDMLRYDRCCPDCQEDVHWMMGTNQRSAQMISHVGPPTAARWVSFGWTVDLLKEHRA
jgi:hypothetical protein